MAAAQDNLTAEHWAEIERLQGDAFEPALGEPFVAIPFAWWSAFRDRCMGDQEIFVAKEIDCKEMLSEASSLALKRGLAENQDFAWAKESVVAKLAEWGYRLSHTIRRVAVPTANGSAKIETYPQICVLRSSEAAAPAAAPAAAAAAAAAAAPAAEPTFTLLISRNASPGEVLNAILGDAAAAAALKLPGLGLRGSVRLHYRDAEVAAAAEGRGDAAWTAGLAKFVAPAVATLGDAARNDEVTQIYLEVRKSDGSWPLGPWWSPGFEPGLGGAADEAAWRKGIKAGTLLDLWDASAKSHLEAEVVDVKTAGITGNILGLVTSGGAAGQDELIVHFRGWSRSGVGMDKSKRSSQDLSPPYTKARPWRQAIRLGDEIEIAHTAPAAAAAAGGGAGAVNWFVGRVSALDFTVQPPTVTVVYGVGDAAPDAPVVVHERTVSLEDSDVLSPHTGHYADGSGRSGGGMHVRIVDYAKAKRVLPVDRFPFPLPGAAGVPPLPPPWTAKWKGLSAAGAAAAAGGAGAAARPGGAGAYEDGAAAAGDHRLAPAEAARMFKQRLSRYFNDLEPAACRQVAKPGFCGLENLGNTCFMNSMLQCMAATMELSDYFLANEHLPEVNVANPLGSKGHMAMAYAALIHAMWSGAFNRVAPADVKAIVGKRAPQFLGWAQQDSQEFMSFFLDLLLEDTCRVHPKPVIGEMPTEGVEAELSRQAWDAFQRRNSSKVADVFAGQFRSHVECNKCGRTSTSFDPFTSFSVPIPLQRWTALDVFYFGFMNERPIKFRLHYLETEPPTGQFLAQWLVGEVRKHYAGAAAAAASGPGGAAASAKPALGEPIEEDADAAAADAPAAGGAGEGPAAGGAGAGSAAAAAGAAAAAESEGEAGRGEYIAGRYIPKPWECLITITTPANAMCMVHATVPHWGNVDEAREAVHARVARGANTNTNVMVFVVPGSPSYAETEAHPEVHLVPEPDYDEKLPQADDEDEDGYRMQSRKPAALKPRPKSPIGPVPRDYVIAWLRRTVKPLYAGAKETFTALGDCLILPTRFYAGKRLEGDAVVTQGQLLEHALRGLKRLLLDQGTTTAKMPGALGWFSYVWDRRRGLTSDYGSTGPLTGVIKPGVDADEPIAADRAIQWMLDLPDRTAINGDEAAKCESVQGKAPREATINLDACVRRFGVREQLGEKDMWYCNRCKEHVRAYKKMDVWRLPPCLIIHLKRFQYERGFFQSVLRGKINEMIDFPTRGLDMAPYLPAGADAPAGGAIYDLYAVSEHSGGMGGGHYTATTFNQRTGQWMDCNDSSVRPSDERSAVSASAYVLFYRRRPVGAGGPAHGPGRAPAAVAVPEGGAAGGAGGGGAAAPAIDSDEDQPTDQEDMQGGFGPAYSGIQMLQDGAV